MTKTTRKALLSSVVALLVCLTMLVGTTFAWFTDTASTAVNTVKSGTLKVDIVDTDGNSLKDGTLSFKNKEGKTDIKWEPGVTFNTDTFKISNKGSLALKYKIAVNGLDGDSELLKVIDFSVVNKTTGETVSLDTFVGHLAKDETSSDELYIQGKMKTDAGNAYMGKELEGISLVVTATQDTVEYDSTTKDYDKDATFPDGSASDSTDDTAYTTVTTAEALTAAIANGGNIKLDDDITVTAIIHIENTVKIDLNGKKLTSEFGTDADNIVGGGFDVGKGGNLTIINGIVETDDRMGMGFQTVVNRGTCYIDNCTLTAYMSAFYHCSEFTSTLKNCTLNGSILTDGTGTVYLEGNTVFGRGTDPVNPQQGIAVCRGSTVICDVEPVIYVNFGKPQAKYAKDSDGKYIVTSND